uniref:Ig-like domain-containing protein n=1 Tax=Neogobius melanostomus TaxID=47308 RepID=A0A8C6T1D3_9GOBI
SLSCIMIQLFICYTIDFTPHIVFISLSGCFVCVGVLCEKFGVTLPGRIEAVRGSCLTIPCSFTIDDEHKKNLHSGCVALWKTVDGDNTVEFTKATTGDLTQKNCTTTVHEITQQQNGPVHLRVDCGTDNPLKYTFTTSVDIKVTEAPPTPTLTPPTLSVTEGESVSVQCSAPVPCLSLPPTLTWCPVLGDVQETLQQQQDETFVKVSTLNFTASHSHHEKNITCSAVYSKEDLSNILYLMTVSPSGPVAEHSNVTLRCSSDASPAVQIYRWYKADGGTHSLIGNSSVLLMKASKDTTVIYCVAQNNHGTDNSTLTQLDVQCMYY